jgi:nanoRNase/pAp phosphatase (c-di-AMP/oligoRNAs hydrolase)
VAPRKTKQLLELLEAHRGERHIVALQDFPDPDAISSAWAHSFICEQFNITVDTFYEGTISHQENQALVRLLDIEMQKYDEGVDLSRYQASVFIDNQGTTTKLTERLKRVGVKPLIIVDQHEKQRVLEAEFTDIRKVGATATIYTEYLKEGALTLDKHNRAHVKLATALMHGIRSDTGDLVRATEEDFLAAAYLSRFTDTALLGEILSVKRSKRVMDVIEAALAHRLIRENYSIAGVGYLRAEERDAIPQAADFLLTEENVHTAVVYGILRDSDKEMIVGSLRTSKVTLNPDDFLKDVFGRDEQGDFYGGGKQDAGGFEVPIGFLAGSQADEEYTKLKWKIYDAQIKRKLLTKIGLPQEEEPALEEE